jgi:uncharacterized protein
MGDSGWPVVEGRSRARLVLRGRLASVARRAVCRDAEFRTDQSLRHVAETLGIPACEIGMARIDGEDWSLELPPPDGATVELEPVAEPVCLGRRPIFLADTHLGRLSRVLRLLGIDSLWRGGTGREEAIETALGEERIVLTRDRGLLFERPLSRPPAQAGALGGDRAAAWRRGMLVLASDPYRQLLEVCARFGLDRGLRPLSLCSACGTQLREASKAEVLAQLPRIVAERYDEFSRCPACGKVFWKGDHARSIEPLLARLRSDLAPP